MRFRRSGLSASWIDCQRGKAASGYSQQGAAQDTLEIMRRPKRRRAWRRLFTASLMEKKWQGKYLDMGFFLGVGGVLTFNNSKTLREVVKYVPMDHLVLETDSRIWSRAKSGKTQYFCEPDLCGKDDGRN